MSIRNPNFTCIILHQVPVSIFPTDSHVLITHRPHHHNHLVLYALSHHNHARRMGYMTIHPSIHLAITYGKDSAKPGIEESVMPLFYFY
jgi:hypothetical protein